MPDASTNTPLSGTAAVKLWIAIWRKLDASDRHRLVIAAAAMIGSSVLTAMMPILIGVIFDSSVKNNAIVLSRSIGALVQLAVFVIAAALLEVVRRQLVETVATGFEREARSATYRQLFRQDLDVLRDGEIGRMYGRANRSIEGAVKLLKLGALDLLPAMSLAIAALAVAFAHNIVVGAAMSLVVPTGLGLVWLQIRSQRGVRLRIRDRKEEIDGSVVEKLPAMETIRVTGAEDHFVSQIHRFTGELRETELTHHRAMSIYDAVKAINDGVWLMITVVVAVTVTAADHASTGALMSYILLYLAIIAPMHQLHRIVDEAAESAQQTHDLFGMLSVPEDEGYTPAIGLSVSAAVSVGAPAIAFKKVSFTHKSNDRPTLRDVSLQIEAGEKVGIVSPTAGGKSTLLKLIPRVHHGFEGSITINGRDLRGLVHEELKSMVGYMPQEARLFKTTILENILFGREATMDEVAGAARRAFIHEEIMRMSDGYETLVKERGENLSGGQKQRISLARTLLSAPPILLLDEPTSALDGPSQDQVSKAINALTDVTLVVVAHRLETLKAMDRILILRGGRVVEERTYEGYGQGKPKRCNRRLAPIVANCGQVVFAALAGGVASAA